jgi:hypothetical protein
MDPPLGPDPVAWLVARTGLVLGVAGEVFTPAPEWPANWAEFIVCAELRDRAAHGAYHAGSAGPRVPSLRSALTRPCPASWPAWSAPARATAGGGRAPCGLALRRVASPS